MSDTVSSRADTTGWNVQSMPPEWCPSVPSEGTPYVAASRPGYDEAKDRPRSAGTKLFNVYANETGGCEAVKVGWSWPAFSFGAFWALYKRMWGIGLGVLLTWFVLTLAGTIVLLSQAVNSLAVVGGMAGWFVFGSYGNKWRARHLLARGFTLRGTISASSARQAATLYSDGALSTPAPSSNSTDAEGKTA